MKIDDTHDVCLLCGRTLHTGNVLCPKCLNEQIEGAARVARLTGEQDRPARVAAFTRTSERGFSRSQHSR